jgi:hypothetical protein
MPVVVFEYCGSNVSQWEVQKWALDQFFQSWMIIKLPIMTRMMP